MTCAWIETSSADTASSRIMISGPSASARAMRDALSLAAGKLAADGACACSADSPTGDEHFLDPRSGS